RRVHERPVRLVEQLEDERDGEQDRRDDGEHHCLRGCRCLIYTRNDQLPNIREKKPFFSFGAAALRGRGAVLFSSVWCVSTCSATVWWPALSFTSVFSSTAVSVST